MVIATVLVATPRSEAALGTSFEIGSDETLGAGTESADIVEESAGGVDWTDLPLAGGSFGENQVKVINDTNFTGPATVLNPATAAADHCPQADDDIAKGGTKIDVAPFVVVTGQPSPGKDDLCQVYVAYDITGGGDVLLYAGVVRRETVGTTAVAIELNKVGHANRQADDLLVSFEFDGSGPVSKLEVREWDPSLNSGSGGWSLVAIPGSDWEGTSWAHFGEVAVNLSSTNLLPPPTNVDDCTSFSSIAPYGWNGNSANSQVGDWGGINPIDIPRCGQIEITKVATPAADDSYVFEWEISDNADIPLAPASGEIVDGETVSVDVVAGEYTLDEIVEASPYELDRIECSGEQTSDAITVGVGDTVSCTIYNVASSVQVVKSGAGDDQVDFDFSVTGQTDFSLGLGEGSAVFLYAPDTPVTITETLPGGLPSWDLTSISCVDSEGAITADVDLAGGSVTFDTVPGDLVTCTFVNEQDAQITVIKNVVNNNGGTAVVADFDLFLNGNPVTSGVANAVSAGQYTVTETGVDGYAMTSMACLDDDTAADVGDPTFDIVEGQSVTCTIVNDDIAPGLTLVKSVINDNGGTAVPADFQLRVNGQPAAQGVALEFPANTLLTVTEDLLDGYLQTSLVCVDNEPPFGTVQHPVTLAPGQSVTCTITNNDRPRPSVTVIKTTSPASTDQFSFMLSPGDVRSISGNNGTTTWAGLTPGSFQLTELTAVNWLLEGVSCNGPWTSIPRGATFTLDWEQNITCTFSNTPALADLQVTKTDNVDPVVLSDENPVGQIEYTMVVSNLGPAIANNVTLVDTLPATVTYVSHSTTAGTCAHAAGVLTCSLGTIPTGGTVTVKVVVSTQALGSVTDLTLLNVVEVSSTSPDPVPGNNLANETTEIVEVLAEAILPFTGFYGYVWGYIALALMALGSTLLATTRSRGRHVRRSALYRMILG